MTRVSMIPETAKIPFHKLSLKLTAVLVEEDDGGGGSVIEFNQNGVGFDWIWIKSNVWGGGDCGTQLA